MTIQTRPDSPTSEVQPALLASPRYYAFDCVRALAMLLGVFYHWQFVSGGFGLATGPKGSIDHWLHSFRMALFFLISGFFANMMLGKYGVLKYLRRRWWRIGMPLAVAIVGFAALGFAQDYFAAAPVGGPGGVPGGVPGGRILAGRGLIRLVRDRAVLRRARLTRLAALGCRARILLVARRAVVVVPHLAGILLAGRPERRPVVADSAGLGGREGGGFGGAPVGQTPAVATPEAPVNPFAFGGPPHPWADWLTAKLNIHATRADGRVVKLGASALQLQHLWFLWYLLVFCTVALVVAVPLGKLPERFLAVGDRVGGMLVRWDVAPLLLGVLALPALLHAKGMDWTLTNPAGFSGYFPDFFRQYFNDMPFYFVYFLFGWWFFRLRGSLNGIARPWLWNLALGVAGFAFSQWLYDKYNPAPAFGFGFGFGAPAATMPAIPHGTRFLAMTCYGVGAAYSGFGLMGLFQKYLDRPTRLGKYFTDTMLWVYLVQLALIPQVANWVDYNNTSWWEATLGGVVLVTGIALVMFELFVRHTPLVYVFGPASLSKKKRIKE